MKKFIENGFDVNWSSPMHAVQSIIVMLLTAPFKLVMTISSKILYLPRSAIEKVILNSVIVASVITLANVVFRLYFRTFTLFNGKVPIVMLAGVTAFLAMLYAWVTATDFKVFTELNDLFPSTSEDCDNSEIVSEVNQEHAHSDMESRIVQTAVGADKFSDSSDNFSADAIENINTVENEIEEKSVYEEIARSVFVDKVSAEKVNGGIKLPDEQLTNWRDMLKSSINPSEFLSEDLLRNFNPEDEIADELVLDYFSLEVIPNTFKALA